jgi:hypothetical protein
MWANAIVSTGADAGRLGQALRRQLDRRLNDAVTSKAVASGGADGCLHHADAVTSARWLL